MRILNLTQHTATPDQLAAGVINIETPEADVVFEELNFRQIPTYEEVEIRAANLAEMVAELIKMYDASNTVMIGGAPFLMHPLVEALVKKGIQPCFAFSLRESVEKIMPNGSVVKTSEFKHQGMVTKP